MQRQESWLLYCHIPTTWFIASGQIGDGGKGMERKKEEEEEGKHSQPEG